MNAFKRFTDYQFIMKLDEKIPETIDASNIHVEKWVPQADLLGKKEFSTKKDIAKLLTYEEAAKLFSERRLGKIICTCFHVLFACLYCTTGVQ